MSAGLGYSSTPPAPKTDFQNQIVDNATSGLAKRAAEALATRTAMEMVANGPAKKSHHDVLRSNTGWEMDPVAWAKRAAATRLLTEQTEHIASALARGGINVIRDGDVTLISAVTGIVESLPVYLAVRFLPTIAARDRRPMVNALKLFMSGTSHKTAYIGKYMRYAVFTAPQPVPAFGTLREEIQALSRRISKWAHRVKKYGVKVLFRGIEFTRKTAEERGMTDRYAPGTILYHVHANVIYWPTRNMKGEWEKFLRETHEFMGSEWKDNGKVEGVEEIVKYCSKPADTLAASDDELVWLYRQAQRLKICQPLGPFAEWLRDLNKRKEKVVRVHIGHGDGKLMRVRKLSRKADDGKPTDTDDDFPEDGASSDDPPEKPERKTRIESGDGSPPANIVLGLSLPQWRHSPWAEPMIMVQHYNPARLSEEDGLDIREWQKQAREWWDAAFGPEPEEALRVARMAMDRAMSADDVREAAEAAPYIVHTCRPTVRHEDEEVDEEELDGDVRSILRLFEGATVVRLKPRPPTEDDGIPFETDEQAKWEARMQAIQEAHEPGWAKRRLSAPYHPSERWDDSCRIAA
nr:hypothetical protein [Ochrobactrum sp. UNC390CL2Tsu3S39]